MCVCTDFCEFDVTDIDKRESSKKRACGTIVAWGSVDEKYKKWSLSDAIKFF